MKSRAAENKILIGITGGIGAGKSSVSRFWAERFQLPLIDLDQLCAKLMEKGQPGWLAVRRHFNDDFFLSNGGLDRKKLRDAIFREPALRRRLDDLIHPLARREMRRRYQALPSRVVLIEVPLLFEAGWQGEFSHIVVVFAQEATCCRRLVRRDKISTVEAARAVRSQQSLMEKAMLADHVIDNSGCWLHCRIQVVHLAEFIKIKYNEMSRLQKSLDRNSGRQ